MITIKLTNKLAYTLIAVLAILTISLVVYAFGGNQPSVMGHTFSEIEPPSGCSAGQILSWDGSNWVCIDELGGMGECTEILNTKGNIKFSSDNSKSIPTPESCRNDNVCTIVAMKIRESDDVIVDYDNTLYFQSAGNQWVNWAGYGVGDHKGTNGDSSSTQILGWDSAHLYDDHSKSPDGETSPTQWSYNENWDNEYLRIVVCQF